MGTIPLPPWMRRIQQTWYWQNFLMPILVGFIGSLTLQGCLSDIFAIQWSCAHVAINSAISGLAIAWAKGHSVGSSDFTSAGTPIPAAPKLKQLADAAIVLQANASDPASSVTQADASQAAATVTRIDAVVSNVLATAEAKKD